MYVPIVLCATIMVHLHERHVAHGLLGRCLPRSNGLNFPTTALNTQLMAVVTDVLLARNLLS